MPLVPVVQAAGVVTDSTSLLTRQREGESWFVNIVTARKLTGVPSLSEIEERELLLCLREYTRYQSWRVVMRFGEYLPYQQTHLVLVQSCGWPCCAQEFSGSFLSRWRVLSLPHPVWSRPCNACPSIPATLPRKWRPHMPGKRIGPTLGSGPSFL